MRQGSFVRKGVAQAADSGTRPGLHGQTLVSSGHPDLDRLLGGGLPLGSLLLLLEDGWSSHHATLLRYFLAEGAVCGQTLMLATARVPPGGLPKFLPAQLKGKTAEQDEEEGGKDHEQYKLRIAWQYRRYINTDGSQPGGTPDLMPGSLGGGGSISRGSSGQATTAASASSSSGSSGGITPRKPAGLRDWCHHFDLLKSAGNEGLSQCRAELADCSSGSSNDDCTALAGSSVQRLLSTAAAFVQSLALVQPGSGGTAAAAAAAATASMAAVPGPTTGGARVPPTMALPPRGQQHVGRIAVLSLGALGWQLDGRGAGGSGSSSSCSRSGNWQQQAQSSEVLEAAQQWCDSGSAAVRALLQLKGLIRDRRCVAVVSVPVALFSPSDVTRMQHLADGVIGLESVADDSDIARLAPDPASVAGLLHLRKLPSLGAAVPPMPEAALHLVRHKRRRLAITPVEVDPDAEVADAELASGAGKSVAAVFCGGGPTRGEKAMDF